MGRQNGLPTPTVQNPNGSFGAPLADGQGASPLFQRHGKYYGAAFDGALFGGANTIAAPATLSVALTAVYVGLCLSNPFGSLKNLIVQRISGNFIVAPTVFSALGLITGFAAGGITVHTTALVPVNQLVGSAVVPVGKLDQACTLVGTPAWDRWLSATASATGGMTFREDVDGAIVIPPGGYCAVGSSVAGPAAGFLGSMEWEEALISAG